MDRRVALPTQRYRPCHLCTGIPLLKPLVAMANSWNQMVLGRARFGKPATEMTLARSGFPSRQLLRKIDHLANSAYTVTGSNRNGKGVSGATSGRSLTWQPTWFRPRVVASAVRIIFDRIVLSDQNAPCTVHLEPRTGHHSAKCRPDWH